MNLTINIYNSKPYKIVTDIGENETILDFMNKHDILTQVPVNFKCIIYENAKIDNNLLIKNYIKNNQLNFWFKLRWFIE
jgi:hypothetical protein